MKGVRQRDRQWRALRRWLRLQRAVCLESALSHRDPMGKRLYQGQWMAVDATLRQMTTMRRDAAKLR